MKNVRFYQEPGPVDAEGHANVFALFRGRDYYSGEGLGAVYDHSNSAVATCGVSQVFLDGCKAVDEATARKLHPRLFEVLDK